MKTVKDILIFIFGKNQKQRFRRIVIVGVIVILSQCVSFGYDSKGDFYITWNPFVKITKEIK